MLESQIDQQERRETLRNDLKVRQEQEESRRVFADQSLPNRATTFHQFAEADAATPMGRFSAVSAAVVVGSTAIPQYPQASAPFQCDPVPDEPPLGLDNPALEPGPFSPGSGDPTGDVPASTAPLVEDVERVGSPPLSSSRLRRF
jgi:hypothetical protein